MKPSSNGALKASVLLPCTLKTRDLAVRAQEREDRSEVALRGSHLLIPPTCRISGGIALPSPLFCFQLREYFGNLPSQNEGGRRMVGNVLRGGLQTAACPGQINPKCKKLFKVRSNMDLGIMEL